MFAQLQRRRRMTPLADLPLTGELDASPESASVPSDSVAHQLGADSHETLTAALDVPGPSASIVDTSELSTSLYDEADEDLWQQFDDDNYEPRDFFAEEEDPSLDLDDF
ncbi:hypothetical protein OH77DRAFT_1593765 [Trametes cingulata]|nr:hypothetical protein OH77DRAFT_1593765 [Trametes cingulata]